MRLTRASCISHCHIYAFVQKPFPLANIAIVLFGTVFGDYACISDVWMVEEICLPVKVWRQAAVCSSVRAIFSTADFSQSWTASPYLRKAS